MQKLKTIDYYNQNADQFYKNTVSVEFAATQQRFLSRLPVGAHILDFGCGSGRDTKAFLDQGYEIEAIDGSEELCKLASQYTGVRVRHMFFQELSAVSEYDGIWACSSILHLSRDELLDVIRKMAQFDLTKKVDFDEIQETQLHIETVELTDVMTGDRNRKRFLYYQLKMSMQKASRIDIIVSFLMESGVNMILKDLRAALDRGVQIRIHTGNYLGITQPSALFLIKKELGDRIDLRFL